MFVVENVWRSDGTIYDRRKVFVIVCKLAYKFTLFFFIIEFFTVNCVKIIYFLLSQIFLCTIEQFYLIKIIVSIKILEIRIRKIYFESYISIIKFQNNKRVHIYTSQKLLKYNWNSQRNTIHTHTHTHIDLVLLPSCIKWNVETTSTTNKSLTFS